MMRQFEVMVFNGGERYLALVYTERWDFYIGFRKIIRRLP